MITLSPYGGAIFAFNMWIFTDVCDRELDKWTAPSSVHGAVESRLAAHTDCKTLS